MKLSAAVAVAAASSLVAGHAGHHAHRHQHKRDIVVTTVVSPNVEYVYVMNGVDIPADDACEGIKDGQYEWADGAAPAGACGAPTTSSTTSVPAAVFLQQTLPTTPSTTSTSTTSSTTSTTHTTSTSTPSPAPVPATTSTSSKSSVATSSSTQSYGSGGGVTIKNNMGQTIYLWSTSNIAGTMVTLSNGQTYQENWQLNSDGGGISIKIATTPSEGDVAQFEYTLVKPYIWWDVSLINLLTSSLFDVLGFTVTTDNSNCRSVKCPPGETQCSDAYLFPTDDQATRSCADTTNMLLTLGIA